jgi:hypothetical protein
MPRPSRYLLSLLAVIAIVVAPLLAAALASDRLKAASTGGLTAAEVAAATPRIAARVEALRRLSFDGLPRQRIVSVREVERIYAREQSKEEPPARASADEAALRLLGLLGRGESVADVGAGLADQVAGAYDPERRRLFIVRSPSGSDPAMVEMTLAHELDHALEDQRFGLPDSGELADDDRGLAEQALVEGSATELMLKYAERYIDPAALLRVASDPAVVGSASSAGLPEAFEAELGFTYLRGRAFIASLLQLGRHWNLVDIALRSRPPISTEQVLHPYKYLIYERPLAVSLRADRVLPAGWRHLTGGVLGEFDTFELLRRDGGERAARAAAAGWGGQRTQLWQRGSGPCKAPCRSRDALVAAWRWDTRADRLQFARAIRRYLADSLGARATAAGLWTLHGGAVALSAQGGMSTVAFAPGAGLARRLAAAPRGR